MTDEEQNSSTMHSSQIHGQTQLMFEQISTRLHIDSGCGFPYVSCGIAEVLKVCLHRGEMLAKLS